MAVDDGFIEDKNDRLGDVPDKFVNQVQGLEPKVAKEIEAMVAQLDTQDGQILLTEKNQNIVNSINSRLQQVIFDEQYEASLTEYIGEFGVQSDLNNKYFSSLDPDFTPTQLYQNVLRNSQSNAIQLLNEDAFTQVLITPLKSTLEAAVSGQGSFADTLANLRYIIEGDDKIDGRLSSHVKRIAYDAFAVSDRSYSNTVANDLGLEFYRYTGGKVKETRCFCEERYGKYFHRKEIEDWGNGKNVGSCGYPWEGMNSNTDATTIFYYVGGYNCKHNLTPVSLRSVPSDVIARVKSKGYIK